MYSLHVTHFYFFEGELLIRFMIPIILFLDVQLMAGIRDKLLPKI